MQVSYKDGDGRNVTFLIDDRSSDKLSLDYYIDNEKLLRSLKSLTEKDGTIEITGSSVENNEEEEQKMQVSLPSAEEEKRILLAFAVRVGLSSTKESHGLEFLVAPYEGHAFWYRRIAVQLDKNHTSFAARFEIFECYRRLMLSSFLVCFGPGTPSHLVVAIFLCLLAIKGLGCKSTRQSPAMPLVMIRLSRSQITSPSCEMTMITWQRRPSGCCSRCCSLLSWSKWMPPTMTRLNRRGCL